jgi:hypothetical protein
LDSKEFFYSSYWNYNPKGLNLKGNLNPDKMPYKLSFFLLAVLLFINLSCTDDPKKEATTLAKKWCTCNEDLVDLHQQLKEAESPEQRQSALDEMHKLVAQNMQCLGGESKWVQKDQQMSDAQKDQFLKTFRQVKEEECPEVFRVIAELEEAIKQY